MILPNAEPFFFLGEPHKPACLLSHGFTGAPTEMRWMGEYLAHQGYTVLGLRLAGHGTRPEHLGRVRWQDWIHDAEDGWHILRALKMPIFLVGLSMGGAISLMLAARLPAAGVIAMSTPAFLPPGPGLRYLRVWSMVIRNLKSGPPDWRNPIASEGHVHYPYFPLRSVLQLKELLAVMHTTLPAVSVPVLLVHSRLDRVALPESMPMIYEKLGTADKQMLWVENSGHVLPREPDRETVFRAACEFMERTHPSTPMEP